VEVHYLGERDAGERALRHCLINTTYGGERTKLYEFATLVRLQGG
jgi:hypothetical protein